MLFLLFLMSLLSSSYAQTEKKTFYTTGQIKEVAQYDKNGKLTGEAKAYHPNGKLERIGQYQNGKQIGEWKQYFKTENYQLLEYLRMESKKIIGLIIGLMDN